MLTKEEHTAHLQVPSFESMHLELKRCIEQCLFYQTGKTQDSDDLVQEILIKLWINWQRVKTMKETDIKNYVFIMARNHVISKRRENSRPKRNKGLFLKEYSKIYSGYYLHDDILVAEGFKLHNRAVNKLAKKERTVYWYHQNDYSPGEIANMLNRSINTVHNQLYSAQKSIKIYFNKAYGLNLQAGRKNCCKPVLLN